MKPLLKTAVFALLSTIPAHASGIHPDWYLLQITANDLSTSEQGPAPYAEWFAGPGFGEIGYLIYTAVPEGIIKSWALLQCPPHADCVPTSTPASMPSPVPSRVPEPDTFWMLSIAAALIALPVRIWFGKRSR